MKNLSIEKILCNVEKPARYTGNELHSVKKDKNTTDVRFCFCFPDTYEIGMSHLGLRVLYQVLNDLDYVWCERSFMPWVDMEAILKERNIPLFALESQDSLACFDILGFTLQYEMSYTNILAMLDMAKVPLTREARGDGDPFVCAGGPCAVNPEPLADFIDFFMVGEGEEVICEVMAAYRDWKKAALPRIEYLRALTKIEGVYVPAFYEVEYNEDNTIKRRIAKDGAPEIVRKRLIADLDKVVHPEKIMVPYTEIVHDRVALEIFRGCIRGCRFCQAGFIYRPVRERSADHLVDIAKHSLSCTGYDEISLASLSTSDYKELKELTDKLMEYTQKNKINFSLPSLRMDNFDLELAKKAQAVRKSGLTFAPEAGTQRLRDVINKNVQEEDLLNTSYLAFSNGWSTIKLYFMIGLPYETNEDVLGIKELAYKTQDQYYKVPPEKRPRGLRITVSTSSFVPKPFTPFMWARQDTMEELTEKQELLRNEMRSKKIVYNWHDSNLSILEGVFARGDRRLGKVLLSAYQKGCRLDGWHEHFKYDKWMEAFEENGVDYTFYNHRQRSYDENLPWDFIDVGVTKEFLKKENEKAKQAAVTPNCREKCSGCGMTKFAFCDEGGKKQ